jgi:archaellum component FlaC
MKKFSLEGLKKIDKELSEKLEELNGEIEKVGRLIDRIISEQVKFLNPKK